MKCEKIQEKKTLKNKLTDTIKKLGALNDALEQTQDEATLNRTLEVREEFQSKYYNYFRKEAHKTIMFRQMNLEKHTTPPPTKNKTKKSILIEKSFLPMNIQLLLLKISKHHL